tara:strand:+ start:203 stop:502 length:300 start_codon:yes stop_codon:yes gene_type:complete
MANRYENIEILRTELGKRYKKTTRYPKMDRNSNDTYIFSIQGDRLDNLAYKFYNDSRLWWILARANNLGKGDMEIPIGKQLRIPYNFIEIYDEYLELNK